MTWKTLPWAGVPRPETPADLARRTLARALRATAAVLGRVARRLQASLRRAPAPALPPVLEFYAEAGAPEGALYLDGELVGRIEGVSRL